MEKKWLLFFTKEKAISDSLISSLCLPQKLVELGQICNLTLVPACRQAGIENYFTFLKGRKIKNDRTHFHKNHHNHKNHSSDNLLAVV